MVCPKEFAQYSSHYELSLYFKLKRKEAKVCLYGSFSYDKCTSFKCPRHGLVILFDSVCCCSDVVLPHISSTAQKSMTLCLLWSLMPLNQYSLFFFCSFSEKSGYCRSPAPVTTCESKISECTNDFDCFGESKCCFDGCRKTCQRQQEGMFLKCHTELFSSSEGPHRRSVFKDFI